MNRMAIDFETLGTKADCAVLSLGWCVFDEKQTLETSTVYFNLDEQIKLLNRTVESATLAWWMTFTNPHARSVFELANSDPRVNAWNCLNTFMDDYITYECEELWGWGADFDNAILSHLTSQVAVKPVWKYNASRCGRTLCAAANVKPVRDPEIHHQAGADAEVQALAIQKALAKITAGQGAIEILEHQEDAMRG